MVPYDNHVVGFSGERVGTKGYIELYTTFGEEKNYKAIRIRYLVIDANTSYNILLGRPSINRLMAIVSTPHLAMEFSSPSRDILTVHVDQKEERECVTGTKGNKGKRTKKQGFLVNGQTVRKSLHMDEGTHTEGIRRSSRIRTTNKRLAGYDLRRKHDLGMAYS